MPARSERPRAQNPRIRPQDRRSDMEALKFADLRTLDTERRGRVREIYEEAFPASEREPFEQVVQLAEQGHRIAVVATERDVPVAFAVASRLVSVGLTFVEYMAVESGRRGGGYGTAMLRHFLRVLTDRGESPRLILEVEDPEEPRITSAERLERLRRVRFYERSGAELMAVSDYRVPMFGGTGTQPMRLMYADVGTGPRRAPTAEEAERMVGALYLDGYGLPDDHPLIRARAEGGVDHGRSGTA